MIAQEAWAIVNKLVMETPHQYTGTPPMVATKLGEMASACELLRVVAQEYDESKKKNGAVKVPQKSSRRIKS